MLNREDLKEILEEILNSRVCENSEEHAEQHEWIRARINAEKDRQEFYKEGIKVLIQWSLPAIAAAVWLWFEGHWK
jgi:hypothetical protein